MFWVRFVAIASVVFQVVEDVCCVRLCLTAANWCPSVWNSLVILVCWKGTRGLLMRGCFEDLELGSRYFPSACPSEETHAEGQSLSSCSWTAISGCAWFFNVSEGRWLASEAVWVSASSCYGDRNWLNPGGDECFRTEWQIGLVQLLWVCDWFSFWGQDVVGI